MKTISFILLKKKKNKEKPVKMEKITSELYEILIHNKQVNSEITYYYEYQDIYFSKYKCAPITR